MNKISGCDREISEMRETNEKSTPSRKKGTRMNIAGFFYAKRGKSIDTDDQIVRIDCLKKCLDFICHQVKPV